jgi:hypothetical protein
MQSHLPQLPWISLLNYQSQMDAILYSIMDHNCTKAVILLPCQKEIDSLGVTKLYLERVFPCVGLPKKVISDRDPRFTLRIFKKICMLLKIKQSIASMYYLQTDGQSEKTNQHVATTLHILGNFHQSN